MHFDSVQFYVHNICITDIVYKHAIRLIRYSAHCDTILYIAVYANHPSALHYYRFRLQWRLTCLIEPCLRDECI